MIESSSDYTLSSVTVSDSIATRTLVKNDPQMGESFQCEVDYNNLEVLSGSTSIFSSQARLSVYSKYLQDILGTLSTEYTETVLNTNIRI